MKHVFLYLYEFFLAAAAIVPTFNSLNASAAVDINRDLLGLGSPDPRFDVDVVVEEPGIPLISIFVCIVEFLVHQGVQNFSANIPASIWRVTSYNEVQIVILPDDPEEHIERRLVIWGISQVAGLMINSRIFESATSTLKWEGEIAGRVIITDWPPFFNPRLPSSSGSAQFQDDQTDQVTANVEPTPLNSPNHTDEAINLSVERFHIHASLDIDGPSLDLFDVFRTVIAIVVDAAEHDGNKQVAGLVSPVNLPGVEIDVGVYSVHPTSPPLLQNRWLMKVMAFIPEYMIAQGAFREGIFIVNVGGVRVAKVSVKNKRERLVETLLRTTSVSVL